MVKAVGCSRKNQHQPSANYVTVYLLHISFTYKVEMICFPCTIVTGRGNNSCKILSVVLRVWWALHKTRPTVLVRKSVFSTHETPNATDDYHTSVLNCPTRIRKNQTLIGKSFMFSPCSERPSLTIPSPSSYTALSPLHVTSHDWDIHSTRMRTVCTTHPLYEGLVFVLPLAASIAPGMPSGMWRPTVNTCSVTEWVENEWLDCLQTTRIATMPIVR